jgi:hypothetical protein
MLVAVAVGAPARRQRRDQALGFGVAGPEPTDEVEVLGGAGEEGLERGQVGRVAGDAFEAQR